MEAIKENIKKELKCVEDKELLIFIEVILKEYNRLNKKAANQAAFFCLQDHRQEFL